MSTELETARAALDAKITEYRTIIDTQKVRIDKNEQAMADFRTALAKVEEATTAQAAGAFNRQVSADERSLQRYFNAPEMDVRRSPDSFKTSEVGTLALFKRSTHEGRAVAYGLLDDPNPRNDWQREAQRVITERSVVRACLQPATKGGEVHTPIMDDKVRDIMLDAPDSVARIFSSGLTANGAEWVPSNTFPELERQVQFDSGFHQIVDERALPPQGKMTLPYIEGTMRPYLGGAPLIDDPGNYTLTGIGTRSNDISAVRNVIATQLDSLAVEETIIASLPEITAQIARGFRLGDADIMVNADTAAAHQDTGLGSWNTRGWWGSTGLGGSNDHRKSAIGLRARAVDVSCATDQTAAQDYAGIITALKKMDPEYYANSRGRLKLATSPEWYWGYLAQLSQFLTWDKVGAAATILTGMLGGRSGPSPGSVGFINGMIECVMTPAITADLAASGLYTGSGATTGHLIFDAEDFEWRSVPGIVLGRDESARNSTTTIVAVRRRVFRTRANDTTASKKNVHWSYNLTA